MSQHVPRFLNLPARSDPFALLGLAPQQCTPIRIDEALRLRIARTYNHPDGRSEEAEEVRDALRKAAAALKDPVQRDRLARSYRPPHIRPMLTPFDREALAILVGSGGWNAVSRSRLVSLAQHHGVAPAGLMKVISGLSRYAREGRGHLETADIAADRQRFVIHAGPSAIDRIGEISDSMIKKYAPELREHSPWATAKLSIFFGLMAIVLAIFFVRLLLPDAQPPIPRTTVDSGLVPAEIRPGDRERRGDAADGRLQIRRVISFDQLPSFAIELPDAVARHAEASSTVLDELDQIARQLTITETPSEAVHRRWEAVIGDVSRGWLLLDEAHRNELHAAIADVLFLAADSPPVSKRFISALQPATGRDAASGDDALTLISSPWQVMQLARIIQRTDMPPILGDQARTAFSAANGDLLDASIDRDRPERCAAAWLNHTARHLLERLAYGEDALRYWELWLAAQRQVNDGGQFDRAMLSAVQRLLDSTISLKDDEPGLLLLGRLIGEVDLANSAWAKRDILAMIENQQMNVDRLATLTAVLSANPDAAWFDQSLLLPLDADEVMRRRVRQDIERAWPEVASEDEDRFRRVVNIDPADAKRWHDLHQSLMREIDRDADSERRFDGESRLVPMRHLTAAAQLNAAAALLASDDAELNRRGRRVLDRLHEHRSDHGRFRDAHLAEAAGTRGPTNLNPRARGSAPGATGVRGGTASDGMWAAAYENAGRNQTERMKQLEALQTMGGDLGPRDAYLFVREVYRATPIALREEAQMILTSRFARGVIVAMHMLDLLHEAPRTGLTGDLITRYTAKPLPSVQGENWRREARLALIQHLITLRGSGEREIDELADVIHDAALLESGAVDPSRRQIEHAQTTTDAAHKRYLAWHALARSQLPRSIPVPGDLATLDRRHHNRLRFAESPIQTYVALAQSTLELAAYVTSAEQPALSDALHELLRHAADQRIEAETLLRQAALTELAIAEVWRMRVGADPIAESSEDRASARDQRDDDSSHPARRASPASRLALSMTGMLSTSTVMRDIGQPELNRWSEQLEALDPRSPRDYFELAEDVADAATTDGERALARRLFAIAGVLAPERFGRSACLALAQMEDHRPMVRQFRAVANLLDPYAAVADTISDPATVGNETRDHPASPELGEALSSIRLGRGNHALAILRRPSIEDLFQHYLANVEAADLSRLKAVAREARRASDFDSLRIDSLLLVEQALLAGAERPWTADIELYERRPLVEVDEEILHRMLGRDAGRYFFREGRWVSSPD